jgi:phosphonoacetaldehyde hydrolase
MTKAHDGSVRLVVADLAGTTVDYGSCAPAGAFVELFRRHGVDVTQDEARGPMGLQKRDHIAALARLPRIATAWTDTHGRAPDDSAIDKMYAEFIPLQVKSLPDYGDLIPGVVETVGKLRSRGIRVAATTGYNREMLEVVLACAARQGFVPDATFCAEDVAAGRPAPWMIYRSMEALGAYPPECVVNFGDTLPDVASGRNAGVWSVGVTRTGNMVGLGRADEQALPRDERGRRLADAERAMKGAGAHFVIESFADCTGCIDAIEARLARGERP